MEKKEDAMLEFWKNVGVRRFQFEELKRWGKFLFNVVTATGATKSFLLACDRRLLQSLRFKRALADLESQSVERETRSKDRWMARIPKMRHFFVSLGEEVSFSFCLCVCFIAVGFLNFSTVVVCLVSRTLLMRSSSVFC